MEEIPGHSHARYTFKLEFGHSCGGCEFRVRNRTFEGNEWENLEVAKPAKAIEMLILRD
jgi:hypothetical protein